jgi:hypothetical protein
VKARAKLYLAENAENARIVVVVVVGESKTRRSRVRVVRSRQILFVASLLTPESPHTIHDSKIEP